MRKYLIITAAIVTAIAVAGTALALTASQTSTLKLKPSKVPKNTFVNEKIKVHNHTEDASDPTATPPKSTRVQLNFDNDIKFHTAGVKKCKKDLSADTTSQAKADCPKSIVGGGSASATLQTPGPTDFPAVVTAFNGPLKGGKPTILLHTFIGPPINAAAVLKGKLKNSTAGADYGKNLDVTVPPIQGGAGAIKDFKAHVKRGRFVQARCHDANHKWNMKAKFTYSDAPSKTVNAKFPCQVKH